MLAEVDALVAAREAREEGEGLRRALAALDARTQALQDGLRRAGLCVVRTRDGGDARMWTRIRVSVHAGMRRWMLWTTL